MTPGKKPASATPSRTRSRQKPHGPVTAIMAQVISPQLTMMRASQRRAPVRLRIKLLGTSKAR
jgi:hypothetical protein